MWFRLARGGGGGRGGGRLSRYNIRAKGSLPHDINRDNERVKHLGYLQCFSEIINSKQKCVRFEFFKMIEELILSGFFRHNRPKGKRIT